MTATHDINIYADESCLGNQFKARANPGGAGGLMEHWTGDDWVRKDYWISEPDTTNNRMALRSAIVGLDLLLTKRCRVRFVSDSQYLVKGITEWIRGWKARGWRRKGGEIENLDLWKELDALAAGHLLQWLWVRGHDGHPQNEYANHLATTAAQGRTSSNGLIDSGYGLWLAQEREEHQRYVDYFEHSPPS